MARARAARRTRVLMCLQLGQRVLMYLEFQSIAWGAHTWVDSVLVPCDAGSDPGVSWLSESSRALRTA
eukprot:10271191-Alexandrium_andersonii.AAC.1